MLEKLVDLLREFAGFFQVFTYVDQFEGGVVLRCGVYHRSIVGGVNFLLPFGLERAIVTNIKPGPLWVDSLSVCTKDGFLVHTTAAIVWSVYDTPKFLLAYEDTESQLSMLIAAAISQHVRQSTWDQLQKPRFADKILLHVRKDIGWDRGVVVASLELVDVAHGEANRLWIDGVDVGAGEED